MLSSSPLPFGLASDTKFTNVDFATKQENRGEYLFLDDIYPGVIPSGDVKNNGVENEHFIVWMRTAALPKFRKLYGRIHQKIPAGQEVTFSIDACTSHDASPLVCDCRS